MLRADRRAEQAERLHALDDVRRVDVVMLERMDVRLDLAVEKPPDAVEDQLFLLEIGRRAHAQLLWNDRGRFNHGDTEGTEEKLYRGGRRGGREASRAPGDSL